MDIGIENVSLEREKLSTQENQLQEQIMSTSYLKDETSPFSIPFNQFTTIPFYNKFITNNSFEPTNNSFNFLCKLTGFYDLHIIVDSSFEDFFGDRYIKIYKNNSVIYSYQSPLLYRPLDYTINISLKTPIYINDVISVKMLHNCQEEDLYLNHDTSIISFLAII